MIRIVSALLLGIAVSLGLFWLMQYMVMNNQQRLEDTSDLRMVEFVRLKRETRIEHKDRKLPDKPPPKKRPPPPRMQMAKTSVMKNDMPDLDMPNLDMPLQAGRFSGPILGGVSMGAGKVSSNVIPLVRIPPRYPMRAARRKIEGWVKVEFTITENGTVKDAVVVDSQPPEIFNREALQAIARWKFKAKIIDGEAFEQRAVQVLQFKLSK